MSENFHYLPEGLCAPAKPSLSELKAALESGKIMESVACRCDVYHTLHFDLGGIPGTMSHQEAIAPWISGAERDISVLSRVGKQTCFTVIGIDSDNGNSPVAHLSRRKAQESAMSFFLESLKPGMILPCRVVRLESFGVFLDIGCGIIAMLPIKRISISRMLHPRDRFRIGQQIPAVVLNIDRQLRRITMTHRELLGTWQENADLFHAGETVPGTVRGVMSYGAFIELTPNLSGLADINGMTLTSGDRVSVFIKNIRPEQMKIKLQIIEKLPSTECPVPFSYHITEGQLDRWVYSPAGCDRPDMETDFTFL